ncbi:hypothetical protein C7408_10746 [Paraburkholderia caballeronis]|nr:hypothetical protein C7408_10746 [Paraburkholderia caballeronis]TDV16942.1 hypothetical protein C7406_107203 [Paraburkholderia caballeronis]TDV25670.1 hypothetical protein C7404_10746 [Paraburkholderia caballeronis]
MRPDSRRSYRRPCSATLAAFRAAAYQCRDGSAKAPLERPATPPDRVNAPRAHCGHVLMRCVRIVPAFASLPASRQFRRNDFFDAPDMTIPIRPSSERQRQPETTIRRRGDGAWPERRPAAGRGVRAVARPPSCARRFVRWPLRSDRTSLRPARPMPRGRALMDARPGRVRNSRADRRAAHCLPGAWPASAERMTSHRFDRAAAAEANSCSASRRRMSRSRC